MKNGNLLKVKKLTKKFDNKIALDNINIEINRGEVVALIGSSGSGKSTFMNLITRTIKSDSGEILIDGEKIDKLNNKLFAKKVGMLRQQFDLVKNIKVVHNVLAGKFNEWGFWKSFFSLFKPQNIEEAKIALEKMDLIEKLYEMTSSLSGGQQQRVALARLLVQNPLLILADEPVSSLDPVNSEKVLSLITNMARNENKTLIASMHSIEYSKKYFDRIIGLKNGKVIFDDKIENISDEKIKILYGAKNE